MLMTSSLLYENPTYMTFFNTSAAFTPRPSSPWKLKKISNCHSWTHSSRGIETILFLSESVNINILVQDKTKLFFLNIRQQVQVCLVSFSFAFTSPSLTMHSDKGKTSSGKFLQNVSSQGLLKFTFIFIHMISCLSQNLSSLCKTVIVKCVLIGCFSE